jgi:hypothetical protein
VGLGEVTERQHVLLGLVHQCGSLGEALRQRGGQIIPAGLDLRCGFLGEHRAQSGGDHALVSYSFGEGFAYGDALQEVAGKVDPAAMPDAALQLASDGLGQTGVGVTDHEPDASEASLLEVGDELSPEGLALAVAHLEPEQLTAPVVVHPHGHHHSPGADCKALPSRPLR